MLLVMQITALEGRTEVLDWKLLSMEGKRGNMKQRQKQWKEYET